MIRIDCSRSKYIVTFLFGVLVAGVLVIVTCQYRKTQNCLLNRDLLLQIPYMTIQKKQLFLRILSKRMKWLFLFCMFSFTPIRKKIFYLFFLGLGYGAGALLMLSLVQYGWFGILVTIGALMPQIFFLIPAYIGTIRLVIEGREQHAILVKALKCVFLFLIAIYMESYVNLYVISFISEFI